MSWFRVDDNLHAHRKARRAGAEAMGLWVMCGSYASSQASDGCGILEPDEVEAIALTLGLKAWKRAAEKLVSVGLWHYEGRGYVFHDWDHYREGNGEAVLERRREKDAARKRALRASAKEKDNPADVSADVPGTQTDKCPHPPVPSRPVPTEEGKPPQVSGIHPRIDPELGNTFAAALLAAGLTVAPSKFAWQDLGAACGTYWPHATAQQRHGLLAASVAEWVRTTDAKKSRGWDHREYIRWANEGNANPVLQRGEERQARMEAQRRRREEYEATMAAAKAAAGEVAP